jgi:hypothetical protein
MRLKVLAMFNLPLVCIAGLCVRREIQLLPMISLLEDSPTSVDLKCSSNLKRQRKKPEKFD